MIHDNANGNHNGNTCASPNILSKNCKPLTNLTITVLHVNNNGPTNEEKNMNKNSTSTECVGTDPCLDHSDSGPNGNTCHNGI